MLGQKHKSERSLDTPGMSDIETAPPEKLQELSRLLGMALGVARAQAGEQLEADEELEAAAFAHLSEQDAHLMEYLAASVLELQRDAEPPEADDLQSWRELAMSWVGDSDPAVAAELAGSELAQETLAEGLLAMAMSGADGAEAEAGQGRFDVGDHVLALQAIDQAWRPALVMARDGTRYMVRFKQFGNPQEVAEEELAPDASMLEEEAEADASQCKICLRQKMPLTFHHLVPRETHTHVLKRGRLAPEVQAVFDAWAVGKSSVPPAKRWLSTYGVLICRPCHSQVHRVAPNARLALELNTLPKLQAHPAIRKWRAWAARQ